MSGGFCCHCSTDPTRCFLRLNPGWLGRRCLQLELFFSTGTAHACGQISLSRLGVGDWRWGEQWFLLAVGGTKDHGVMVFWRRKKKWVKKCGGSKKDLKTSRFFFNPLLPNHSLFGHKFDADAVVFILEFSLTHLEPPKLHRFLKLTSQFAPENRPIDPKGSRIVFQPSNFQGQTCC